MSGRRSSRTGPGVANLVINAAFIAALLGVGAWAAWPIYATPEFLIVVAAALGLAIGISILGLALRLGWLTVALITLGAYLVLGLPLTLPTAFTDGSGILGGWLRFAEASVFGWKQLVTVTMPVGTYQGLLAPFLVVALATTTAGVSLSWRTTRAAALAAPLLLFVTAFGLLFGSGAGSDEVQLLWMTLGDPRELLIGLIALLLALAYLGWRAQAARRAALRLGGSAVVTQRRATATATVRRTLLGVGVLLLAVLLSASIAPLVSGNDRQVLRTAIAPDVNIAEFTSPLSTYRSSFTADSYDETLLSVDGDATDGLRVRVAVLGHYDGTVFRVVDPARGDLARETAFARVPSSLAPPVDGEQVDVGLSIGGYSGVWLPTVGSLERVTFDGDGGGALSDTFFYNADASAGIVLSGVAEGDEYRMAAVVPEPIALEDLGSPGASDSFVDEDLIPENLVAWVRLQRVGTDAPALAELVERLRARGYLSHSLLEPTGDDAAWMADLGDYSFESSLAGHSVDRIDALFGALVEKQQSTESTEDVDLVAAVGDDEQFAVATALLAQYLGFPSRVVLGFDPATGCDGGDCTGGDLAAWVEVGGADGSWATVDVAPQYENPLSPINDQQRDPENPTDVVPETATEQQPPEANPSGGDQSSRSDEEEGADLTWLLAILRVVGVSLLVLLVLIAPFLTILAAKLRRRRGRLRAADPEARVVGGWDEYVDSALDHGRPAPGSETRLELARVYGTPRAGVLATMADRAVFHAEQPDEEFSTEFWQIVEGERRQLAAGMTRWQRLRAALSLRSFTQHVDPEGRLTGGARRAKVRRNQQ